MVQGEGEDAHVGGDTEPELAEGSAGVFEGVMRELVTGRCGPMWADAVCRSVPREY